jgi:tetratricopeptide (TPR) repeat protein/predicted Ser/Thr protein kinase
MIGATLGHYRLIEQVGAGGVGVVYLARDERLERDVAIKVLSPRTALTDAARRSFRREALALSRTNHPNIATIHDFNSQDGLDYLVMEYIPGRPLSAHVLSGPLSSEETVALGGQLADGLAFAHSKGVVHGDLKPGNIRVTPDGRLKILDFGLARVTASGDTTTQTMTGTGGLGGTLPYMAPEQIRGQVADRRTDVYAAGAVLYEMATGRRPFNATNDAALMNAILRGKPDPPTETNPHISPGLNAIVLKALDLDPSLRYQSASELQVDLHRLSGRPDNIARPPRHNWKVAATAGIVTVILALALIFAWPVRRGEDSSRSAAPTPVDAQTSAAGGSRLRVELSPIEVIGSTADASQWPKLIHALLASDLAGVQEIRLLDRGDDEGSMAERQGLGAADLAVRMRVLTVGAARELQCSVIEAATKEVTFSTRTSVVSEAQLADAIRELAGALAAFFRVRSNGPEFARDLLPWISSRPYKAEAVTAFVQGAMYVFRFQPGEPRRYFQRALDIDPTFVAPRVWRLPTFIQEGKGGAELEYLRSIEARVSPFEQAMIAFVGALADGNLAAQARHLEVALKYAPGNRILLNSLGLVQEGQGDCRAALDTLRPLVDSRWAYAPLYSQWARCAIQLGLVDEIRRTLEDSLALAPPWPDAYGFLDGLSILRHDAESSTRYGGLIARRLKDLGNPVEDVESLARAYDLVGQHALRTGATTQALLLFERAVRFNPSEPGYHDRLADTLEKLGRTRESRQERNRAEALRRKQP